MQKWMSLLFWRCRCLLSSLILWGLLAIIGFSSIVMILLARAHGFGLNPTFERLVNSIGVASVGSILTTELPDRKLVGQVPKE